MVENKLNSKYYGLIWLAAIVSAFVANAYALYQTFTTMEATDSATIALNVIIEIFSAGLIPAAIYYLVASIVYMYGFRRYARAISKNDFIYTCMLVTSIVKFVCGIITMFGILAPVVADISSDILEPTLLAVAFIVMFFAIFVKQYNLNPNEKYESFKHWSTIYYVLYGIVTVLESGLIFLLAALDSEVNLAEYGFYISSTYKWLSIAGVGAFCIMLIITIVISITLQKDAAQYSGPSTREAYMNKHNTESNFSHYKDASSIFGMDNDFDDNENDNNNDDDHHNDNGGGKVFDEFDI